MARSILKDNTAPLPTTSRRVSFAPEVTLHQIEVINPNKRRKTDGGASGYTSLSSESDFEVVHYQSQQELMKEDSNDHLMSLSPVSIRHRKMLEVGDEFDDSPDDGGKPLTDSSDEENREEGNRGMQSDAYSATKRATEVIRNLDDGTEVSMELTTEGKGGVIGKEVNGDSLSGAPLVYASDEDADYSSNDQEEVENAANTGVPVAEEEVDMQLTARIEQSQATQPVHTFNQPEEDMQLTGPVITTTRRYRQPTASSDDEGDDTINLTTLMSKVAHSHNTGKMGTGKDFEQKSGNASVVGEKQMDDEETIDGTNMDLTERVTRVVPQSTILKPNLEAVPDMNDDEDEGEEVEGEDENEDEGEEEDEVEGERVSKTVEHVAVDDTLNSGRLREQVDMESTEHTSSNALIQTNDADMELTEPVGKPSTEFLKVTIDEQLLPHNQDMELTQPIRGLGSKNHPSELTEKDAWNRIPRANTFSAVGEDDEDLKQGQDTETVDSTERQQSPMCSQKSMELTQPITASAVNHGGSASANVVTSSTILSENEQSTETKFTLNENNLSHRLTSGERRNDQASASEVIRPNMNRFVNYKSIPLSQFLDDVHLKFYTDIDSITSTQIGLDSTESITHKSPSIHELILAIPYKEMHALNDFIVNELQSYIKDGEQVFRDFSDQIGNDNLPIMKEYYTTDNERQRDAMTISMNNMKRLAKLESKSTWFKWRTTLTQNVIKEMDQQIELLRECQIGLDEYIQNLNDQVERANGYKSQLIIRLQRLRNAKQTMGNLSQDQVHHMRNTFSQSKAELKSLAEKVDQARSKSQQLEQSLSDLRGHKNELIRLANQVDLELDKCKIYTRDEQIYMKKKYDLLSESTHLKYVRTENTSNLVFVYDGMITIKMDFINHSFQIGDIQSNKLHFRSLVKFIYKLPNFQFDNTSKNPFADWKKFKLYWQKLVQFDTVLDIIRFQWPIELKEGGDSNDDGIRFQFEFFDFEKEKRFIVEGSLNLESLLDFEEKVNFMVKLARKAPLNEAEVDDTLKKLANQIDLPRCTYTFVPNI
ncbi:hypothetical protein KGF57_000668 [Candida theae]|uniref:Spc7 kinetochore protein domain-containing protein n=1 Tax=Candida theae TaxID=1198502 RepID=A0AAD5BIG4_9ASCO|nr:uncharacterized protein KGF57_000668 [Candida theae]KAI5966032.1 hypothetical protein KGF57_000668 [Candida theae]